MQVYKPYDFFHNKPANHSATPEVYFEFDRNHPLIKLTNGLNNGHPPRRPGTQVKTRLFPTTFEICMLPTLRIKKKGEGDVEAIFEFPFNPKRPQAVRGRKLLGEQRLDRHQI